MNRYISILLLTLVLFAACNDDRDSKTTLVYEVEAVQIGNTLSAENLRSILSGLSEMNPLILAAMQHDVGIYRASYNTTFEGKTLRASGLFVLPVNLSAQTPLVVYNHGTIVRGDEPSLSSPSTLSREASIACATASVFNCAVLMPDYLGYGTSTTVKHPYIHAQSIGSSSMDFVESFVEYSEQTLGRATNRNLVIVGYSEGGYAAVALHKAIQEANTDLHVLKTYAGAGPYDNKATLQSLVEKDVEIEPSFLSSYMWVLSVYKDYMGYSRPYSEIYSDTDNAVFQANGYDFSYMIQYDNINLNPTNLFRPEFIEDVKNSADTELFDIAVQNSLTGFVPADSLILFHSEADSWVYPVNTINACTQMQSKGAPVRMELLPESEHKDHGEAATVFLQSVFMNIVATGLLNI
jgi:pimeloyl-ACP methyl ester carboxylesterase